MQGSSIRRFKILVRRNKTKIGDGSVLVSGEVDRRSGKRWRSKEKVPMLFETKLSRKTPVLSSHSRSFRKEHSGNVLVDLVLQDSLLLPKEFIKYVNHVGHGNELRSIVPKGLITGGFRTKTGRYAVFFTVVDPMSVEHGLRETFGASSKARIAPYKNT